MTAHSGHDERGGCALIRWLMVFVFASVGTIQCYAQKVDSVYTLTVTRAATVPGYTGTTPTESFIVTQPPPTPATSVAPPPKGVLILLPGGDGNIQLIPAAGPSPADGTLDINSNNFLVRSRWLFAGKDFAVITLDSATDFQQVTPPGLTGNQGDALHVADVVQVIGWARTEYPGVKVWLVGTSRGTAGAWVASLNAPLAGPDGLVFTSPLNSVAIPPSATDPDSLQSPSVNLGGITVPTLILSNKLDGCAGSDPTNDAAVAALFTSTTVTVKTITGGFNPLSTDPCDALTYHGFFGRERLAVATIAAWIKK